MERLDAGDGKEGGHALVNGKHFNVDDVSFCLPLQNRQHVC